MERFRLCRPDGRKSCAACCGIYNFPGRDRQAVAARLDCQTELYRTRIRGRAVPRLDETLRLHAAFNREQALHEPIYNCEFAGFTDDGRLLPGCLLHPSHNGGRDLRDLCQYGAEVCWQHRCPAYEKLSPAETELVVAAIDDWHLYGLVITDIAFLRAFFALIAGRLGGAVWQRRIGPAAVSAFAAFCSLRTGMPGRTGDPACFGAYRVERGDFVLRRPPEGCGCDPQVARIALACEVDTGVESALVDAGAAIGRALDAFLDSLE